jgi:hypothetical protein
MTTAVAAFDGHTGRCGAADCPQPVEVGWYCPAHALARYKRSTGLERPAKVSLRASAGGSGRA